MRDEAYIESQKPREMFSKLLSDSREFFAAAKREWGNASELMKASSESMKESQEFRSKRPEIRMVHHATGRNPRIAIESALTVATMNYVTSMELLLKGFVGVRGCFDKNSLDSMRNEIRHDCEKVLDCIPRDWVRELEDIYSQAEVADVEVEVFWNSWNPPNSDWIGDTNRLNADTLQQFLRFLRNERMNVDRYSFERSADDEFRVKFMDYRKLEVLHKLIERFLCIEARKAGCWDSGMQISLRFDGARGRTGNLKFRTRKAAFEFDKVTQGKPLME